MAACERPVRVNLTHGGYARHYYYRLPRRACTDPAAYLDEALPLLLTVHCYGGDALQEMDKYIQDAEVAGFALLAPVGMWKSWNTPSCCGQALARKLDDFGFIDAAVQHAAYLLPPLRRTLSNSLFATGFSNGGFVTSLLPSRSRLTWRGLAPAAGHDYDSALLAARPTPILAHHCQEDHQVRFEGCCDGLTRPCCCGIGMGRAQCVSHRSIHARWLSVNRCTGTRSQAGPGGSVCDVGVGCAANTSLCVYPPATGCTHLAWGYEFPGASSVVRFFASEVCAGGGLAPVNALGSDPAAGGGAAGSSRAATCAFARQAALLWDGVGNTSLPVGGAAPRHRKPAARTAGKG